MEEWVFVDACIWASFFDKPNSPEKIAVEDLLETNRAVLVGPVVAEVLMGFKRTDQADWVASRLRLVQYLEANWSNWRSAANLGRDLAAKGHKLPLTDLLIVAVAQAGNAWVYTTDPHFDLFSDLKRYRPG